MEEILALSRLAEDEDETNGADEVTIASGRGGKSLQYDELKLTDDNAYKGYGGTESSNAEKSIEVQKRETQLANLCLRKVEESLATQKNTMASSFAIHPNSSSFPPQKMATTILTKLSLSMAESSYGDQRSNNILVKDIDNHFRRKLEGYWTNTNELLRHFYRLLNLCNSNNNFLHQVNNNEDSMNVDGDDSRNGLTNIEKQKLNRLVAKMRADHDIMYSECKRLRSLEGGVGNSRSKMIEVLARQLSDAVRKTEVGGGGWKDA